MPYTDPKTNRITDQRATRRDRNVRDQYGRLYLAALELTQQGPQPTELVTAGWPFSDPLRTLATGRKHYRPVRGEFGEIDPSRLLLDVKGWFDEVKEAERNWQVSYWENGRKHYKEAFDPNAAPTEYLLRITGPQPFPSVALLRQAFGLDGNGEPIPGKARDAALLGLAPLTKSHRVSLGLPIEEDFGQPPTSEPPPATGPEGPPDKYQPFVAWAVKQGKTWEEARAMWAEHRASLQEA